MNGIIIVDKPAGWTSHDVVAKLRGVLHEKRIGHGGTLDPMATGVLPVFVGRATRAVEFCENAVKRYTAGIRFGITTDTQDITGTVLERSPAHVSSKELTDVLKYFTGKQLQTPPMYSAIKVNGKKLYDLARKGIEVERKGREIIIENITLLGKQNEDYLIDVTCSKGTYIRTLVNDIGAKIGCGASLSYLRRSAAGIYTDKDAVSIEQIIDFAADQNFSFILPVDSIFYNYKSTVVSAEQEKRCKNGNDFYVSSLPDGVYRIYSEQGEFLALGSCKAYNIRTIKSFFEV